MRAQVHVHGEPVVQPAEPYPDTEMRPPVLSCPRLLSQPWFTMTAGSLPATPTFWGESGAPSPLRLPKNREAGSEGGFRLPQLQSSCRCAGTGENVSLWQPRKRPGPPVPEWARATAQDVRSVRAGSRCLWSVSRLLSSSLSEARGVVLSRAGQEAADLPGLWLCFEVHFLLGLRPRPCRAPPAALPSSAAWHRKDPLASDGHQILPGQPSRAAAVPAPARGEAP